MTTVVVVIAAAWVAVRARTIVRAVRADAAERRRERAARVNRAARLAELGVRARLLASRIEELR